MDIKLLSSISLFKGLPIQFVEKLAQFTKVNYYKKGTLIFDEEKSSHYFIYAIKGWVKLYRVAADGTDVIIDVFDNGHFSGETFLFEESKESYSVQAISDVELLSIPIEHLKQLVINCHEFSVSLLKLTLNKQNKLTMELEHLSIKNAAQRLGCFLLRLCSLKNTENITIKLPYDKSLLASRLGIRPETFSRALNKVCDEYNLQVEGDVLRFKSMKHLAEQVCKNCSKIFPCKEITQ